MGDGAWWELRDRPVLSALGESCRGNTASSARFPPGDRRGSPAVGPLRAGMSACSSPEMLPGQCHGPGADGADRAVPKREKLGWHEQANPPQEPAGFGFVQERELLRWKTEQLVLLGEAAAADVNRAEA